MIYYYQTPSETVDGLFYAIMIYIVSFLIIGWIYNISQKGIKKNEERKKQEEESQQKEKEQAEKIRKELPTNNSEGSQGRKNFEK